MNGQNEELNYFVERGVKMENFNFIPRMFRLRPKYILVDPRETYLFHSLFFGAFSPTCAAVSASWRRRGSEDEIRGLI